MMIVKSTFYTRVNVQNQRNLRRIMRLDLLTELLEEEAAEMRLIAQMRALSEAESLYAVDLTEAKKNHSRKLYKADPTPV